MHKASPKSATSRPSSSGLPGVFNSIPKTDIARLTEIGAKHDSFLIEPTEANQPTEADAQKMARFLKGLTDAAGPAVKIPEDELAKLHEKNKVPRKVANQVRENITTLANALRLLPIDDIRRLCDLLDIRPEPAKGKIGTTVEGKIQPSAQDWIKVLARHIHEVHAGRQMLVAEANPDTTVQIAAVGGVNVDRVFAVHGQEQIEKFMTFLFEKILPERNNADRWEVIDEFMAKIEATPDKIKGVPNQKMLLAALIAKISGNDNVTEKLDLILSNGRPVLDILLARMWKEFSSANPTLCIVNAGGAISNMALAEKGVTLVNASVNEELKDALIGTGLHEDLQRPDIPVLTHDGAKLTRVPLKKLDAGSGSCPVNYILEYSDVKEFTVCGRTTTAKKSGDRIIFRAGAIFQRDGAFNRDPQQMKAELRNSKRPGLVPFNLTQEGRAKAIGELAAHHQVLMINSISGLNGVEGCEQLLNDVQAFEAAHRAQGTPCLVGIEISDKTNLDKLYPFREDLPFDPRRVRFWSCSDGELVELAASVYARGVTQVDGNGVNLQWFKPGDGDDLKDKPYLAAQLVEIVASGYGLRKLYVHTSTVVNDMVCTEVSPEASLEEIELARKEALAGQFAILNKNWTVFSKILDGRAIDSPGSRPLVLHKDSLPQLVGICKHALDELPAEAGEATRLRLMADLLVNGILKDEFGYKVFGPRVRLTEGRQQRTGAGDASGVSFARSSVKINPRFVNYRVVKETGEGELSDTLGPNLEHLLYTDVGRLIQEGAIKAVDHGVLPEEPAQAPADIARSA